MASFGCVRTTVRPVARQMIGRNGIATNLDEHLRHLVHRQACRGDGTFEQRTVSSRRERCLELCGVKQPASDVHDGDRDPVSVAADALVGTAVGTQNPHGGERQASVASAEAMRPQVIVDECQDSLISATDRSPSDQLEPLAVRPNTAAWSAAEIFCHHLRVRRAAGGSCAIARPRMVAQCSSPGRPAAARAGWRSCSRSNWPDGQHDQARQFAPARWRVPRSVVTVSHQD
jgi:hypothetical protein